MIFTSSVFLFLFLPTFLAVYVLLPVHQRTKWMLLASWLFYGWWRVDFLTLFIASTVFTYLVGRRIASHRLSNPRTARRWLTLGVVGNLATLGYFKYFEFGVESINSLLAGLGAPPLQGWQVILPIGISFYVFQGVSYLIDTARGDADGRHRFVDVAAYIALFPQLIAGPIVRFKVLGPQLLNPVTSLADFGLGAQRFMIGFCKKVLIADMVAPIADAAFASAQPTAADAWLGAIAYAVQLFFDFSGYSDMAIGLARMMGLRLLENFALPYRSATITEFWRRWHISLSRWLRDYLYIPLGGNRRGRRRTYVNLCLVMLLGGLWHGASWTFVLWGAWHGGLLVAERLLRESRIDIAVPRALAITRTFVFVLLGWVTFRAESLPAALTYYAGMVGAHGVPLSAELAWQLPATGLFVLVVACAILWLAPLADPLAQAPGARERSAIEAASAEVSAGRTASGDDRTRRPVAPGAPSPTLGVRYTAALVPIFLLGVMRTVADSFSPFLYFQF